MNAAADWSEERSAFLERGWVRFPKDPESKVWLAEARPAAHRAVADPVNAEWLRCEGTWFVGVNVLPNDPDGVVGNSGPFRGAVVRFLREALGLGPIAWDRAQVSVIYPGDPRPREGESHAAFRYRCDRDGAHLDGLLPIGPERKRMLREPHAFVLGLPLTAASADASPMVVWEGSVEIVRRHLGEVLAAHPVAQWANVDLTAAYHAARREVFESCRRVAVHAVPGEAYLVHRLALHGVAPWGTGAEAPEDGRMIAYFRPEMTGSIRDWIEAP